MRGLYEYANILKQTTFASPGILSVLRIHTFGKPLLPNLKTFTLENARGDAIPFIPLFLSPGTTTITVRAYENLPEAVTASMIAALPTLCPNLQCIALHGLPRVPIITTALSDLLLTTDRNILRQFCVNSHLLKEAHEAICKLPALRKLQTVIDGPTALPTLVLPNLTELSIEYDRGHAWLQGFRGASLGKLASVRIHSESDSIGHFLGESERVALTTSIPATLLEFRFYSSRAWKPNYRSLLPFTQLKELVLGFSCELGCSSTIDDDTIIDLARAMPKLETLQFGDRPCQTPAGVTAKGLFALTRYCAHLSELRIHFQVASLSPPETPDLGSFYSWSVPEGGCALTVLDVGEIRLPEESSLMVAITLLRIFPRLKCIEHDGGWEKVADAISHSGKLACCLGKRSTFSTPRRTVDDTSPGSSVIL